MDLERIEKYVAYKLDTRLVPLQIKCSSKNW